MKIIGATRESMYALKYRANPTKSASTKPFLEPRPEPTAHCERIRQAAQEHVLTGMRRLQPLDVLEVHDGGAMDTHEVPGGEALLPFP